jgi:hypothetical protein
VCPAPGFTDAGNTVSDLKKHEGKQHSATSILYRRKKKQQFADFLTQQNVDFVREHRVDFQCVNAEASHCRVDFLLPRSDGTIFFIELDENQHDSYPIRCESIRPIRVLESITLEGNRLPTVFIRFNPDKYMVDGERGRVKVAEWHETVLGLFKEWEVNTEKPMEILYCYYDVDEEGRLLIAKDDDFSNITLEISRANIY